MFIAGTHLNATDYLLVLGLSEQNRQRLAQGQPISVSRESHGVVIPAGLKIVMFAGDTEDSMREQLAQFIGPATVTDQKREQ